MASSIAVVDCGKARWKISIRDRANPLSIIEKLQVETGGANPDSSLESWLAISSATRQALAERSVYEAIAVGGHSFRELASRNAEFASAVEQDFGYAIRVLNPSDEGTLLYNAVSRAMGLNANRCVMDLGGGSVQWAWIEHSGEVAVASRELGTYSIETRFGLVQGSPYAAYEQVEDSVRAEVASALSKIGTVNELVLGSNMWASLLASVSVHLGLEQPRWFDGSLVETEIGQLSLIFDWIKGARVGEFACAYPQNPNALFGVDKALMIAGLTIDLLSAEKIYGTDLGVADGLAIEI